MKKQSLTLTDLLFDVKLVNTEEAFGMKANNDVSKAVIANIKGENKILNVCSEKYCLVPNNEIFLPIEMALTEKGIKYEAKYNMVDNSKFYADYIIKEESMKISDGFNDTVYPKISVTHSYNGLLKYKISVGYFRMVCSNGLVIPIKDYENNFAKMGKHTEKLNNTLHEFFMVFERFLNDTTTIGKEFQKLNDKVVFNISDRLNSVAEKTAYPVRLVDVANEIINKELTKYETPKTDLLIYNGMNEALMTADISMHPEFRTKIDSEVFQHILATH
jgi:hypothetical protein